MTDIMAPDSFEDLSDADKVAFTVAETDATLGRLDRMLAELDGLRTEVTSKLIQFTLGDDGRLLSLSIADEAVPTLDTQLNSLLAAGNDGMRLSRAEFWAQHR